MWIDPRYMVSTTAPNTRSATDSALGVGAVMVMGRVSGYPVFRSSPVRLRVDLMLRIGLLGGLRVESDGHGVAAPESRRARTLLAWLALNPGKHGRSKLAGVLRP